MSDELKNLKKNGTKRSAAGKPAKAASPGDFRFINVDFTEDMKKKVVAWMGSGVDVWSIVERVVGQGYRVGIQYDERNDCYSASLTNRGGPSAFRNACITARGGDAWTAVGRVIGLHVAIADEDWTFLEQPFDRGDIW
jgi:hypothetical protein